MLKNTGISFLFLLSLLTMTACQLAQSAFTRTVNNAGGAFAAAATTLTYVHEGKTTVAYAYASFESYQSELSGLDQQLSSQEEASNKQTIQHLITLYKPAMQVVNQPCLDTSCQWREQVTTLDRASKEFLKAGGQ